MCLLGFTVNIYIFLQVTSFMFFTVYKTKLIKFVRFVSLNYYIGNKIKCVVAQQPKNNANYCGLLRKLKCHFYPAFIKYKLFELYGYPQNVSFALTIFLLNTLNLAVFFKHLLKVNRLCPTQVAKS